MLGNVDSLGMLPGWPDLIVLWRGQFWSFEVKAPGNYPTLKQKQVGEAIEAQGGRWAVVRSVDDAEACVTEWKAVRTQRRKQSRRRVGRGDRGSEMQRTFDRVFAALVATDPLGLVSTSIVMGRSHEIEKLTDVQFDT